MFVNFFIDRPIFASVISIVITLAGFLCLWNLPIAQYPEITPPSVVVSASYTGANAQVVEETVAAPIEEQVNGAEDMLYMNSISTNSGSYSLTVTFDVERDLDMATVDVQNRVALAQPQLPADVVSNGISVKKQSSNILMVLNLVSPDKTRDSLFLDNYAKLNVSDIIARVPGVGNVTVFGDRDYSMRVWLDPDKMSRLGLTTADVSGAIQEQNIQAPAADRSAAVPQGPAVPAFRSGQGPSGRPCGVREHHSSHQRRRLVSAAQGCGPRRGRCQELQ
ncbi:efflux RND transporter permease subunit [Salidesulfovibrio brasiliensis]|uniref:efflux RND transporter permease subunit n=1 Tax=Salidesulfovibrio brasiliensis TaxID=221711 RepID=UPI000A473E63